MKIATWNINSVRLRLDNLARLIDAANPDIICLQETKVVDELFPRADIEALGYPHQAIRGMKSYNGVAILSRLPMTENGGRDWCGKPDCRHTGVALAGGIELHNFYVPAGGDEPDPTVNDKFAHKLSFLDEMTEWCQERRDPSAKRILVGDLNIAPLETDVWSHKQLRKVVSHTEIEIERLAGLQQAGRWIDAVRHLIPTDEKIYSWWSYRAKDWRAADRGRRLDHIWISEELVPALRSVEILKDGRGWPQPSDHAPVIASFDI